MPCSSKNDGSGAYDAALLLASMFVFLVGLFVRVWSVEEKTEHAAP